MSRCSLVLLVVGMVALCVSTATAAQSPHAPQLKACIRNLVTKADSKLTGKEKDVLASCYQAAISGFSNTSTKDVIGDRYVACVDRTHVGQAVNEASKTVRTCLLQSHA